MPAQGPTTGSALGWRMHSRWHGPGIAAGTVSFPLDMYRYGETGKRGNDRSRSDVVDVMRELSWQHTMAVPFGVLDQELDLALQHRPCSNVRAPGLAAASSEFRSVSQGISGAAPAPAYTELTNSNLHQPHP